MYADIDDVLHELGAIAEFLTATSKPSLADVTNLTLPAVGGEIDGVLSARGITVPVTAPASFLDTLKGLNALGAAARVAAALFPNRARADGTPFHEWLQGLYDAGLARLRNGEGVPDAVAASGSSLPTSFAITHPDTVSTDLDSTTVNTIDPVFRRDTRW